MKSRRIRGALLATTILVLCSSCSQKEQAGGQRTAHDASSSPDISPTAAPGVAFNYAYQFSLADDRISATQETHAAACEKLGPTRCRITGMSYSVNQDEQVVAELDLKLDPVVARQFGKSAQQLVERNDGKLIRLDIGSSDEGQVIEQTAKQRSEVSARTAQLQQELARTKPGTEARANIMSRIEALQQQGSEQNRQIESGQAALASTPMEFHYYGQGGVPGFRDNPVREAWRTFVTTVVWLVGILLQAMAVLIPLSVLVLLLLLLWRTRPMRAFRAWVKGPQESDA
jgi:hypothetical protein